ncbi:MAG: IS4 family transposase, partial [Anaeromyxobacter sp.]
ISLLNLADYVLLRLIGKHDRSTAPGGASADQSYKRELHDAMSRFLPHHGLPLLSDDGRVRWTARLLAIVAVLTTWSSGSTLLDRFALARTAAIAMYPTRKRPGDSVEGFFKALCNSGDAVLKTLCEHWRTCVRKVAGQHRLTDGWLAIGVDGSKINCPRTLANEKRLGVSGKNNGGPQLLVTCLFHAATGMLWGWTRDGICGAGERTQLRRLLPLLPPEAMLLADAGFCGYDLLKALAGRGNHFLIRVGSNVTLIKKLGFATREGKQTVYLWPLTMQGRQKRFMPRKLSNVSPPLVLRLIELTDEAGKKIFLLTNVLQKSRLSDSTAARLYRLRWGVEVMWRDLKQTLGHHQVLSRTPERAEAELDWAMAGLWLLQLLGGSRMKQARLSPQSHSPAQTLRAVRSCLTGGRSRRQSLHMRLGMARKDTYRRRGSKEARHRPRKRTHRPPGRPKARTALAIEKRIVHRLFAQPPPK